MVNGLTGFDGITRSAEFAFSMDSYCLLALRSNTVDEGVTSAPAICGRTRVPISGPGGVRGLDREKPPVGDHLRC